VTAVGVLAFVVALLVSVMLHEAGHFLTARHYGMKATQFFVGFGPTLFSRQRGETEYGVKAIPAGGFVKIVGMTPLEEVAPGDEDRAFFRHKPGPRTVVLAAGSTVHFVIAVILVFLTVAAVGIPDGKAAVLLKPQECLALSITSKTTTFPPSARTGGSCPAGTVPGVAAAAGLRGGDRVLEVAGKPVTDYTVFQKAVRDSAGRPLPVVVQRDGKRVPVTLTPVVTTRPDLTDPTRDVRVGTIGVGQDPTTLRHVGPIAAIGETGSQLGLILSGTYDTLTRKLGTITQVYGKHRDPAGFVGVVGVSRVSGEVFNAPIPFSTKLAGFLMLMAGLNLFVGIFNLLPLLPLDGGHIAVLLFETARDKVRRLRGYTGELTHVDMNRLMPLTLGVVALFVGFSVWLLGADIVNPIRLTQ